MNWVVNTFVPVTGEKDSMKLGDIKPSDSFVSSSIDFLESNGPIHMVDDPNLGETEERYVYISNPLWTAAKVAGWYLMSDADSDAEFPKNDRTLALGEGMCVYNADGEGLSLNFSGAVYSESAPITLGDEMNWLGNCSPSDITLKDITVNEKFSSSSIDILASDGPVRTINDPNLGETEERYVYISNPNWTAAKVAGWYLMSDADNDAEYPKNDTVIKAGEGLCVYNADGEDVIISIPSAL